MMTKIFVFYLVGFVCSFILAAIRYNEIPSEKKESKTAYRIAVLVLAALSWIGAGTLFYRHIALFVREREF